VAFFRFGFGAPAFTDDSARSTCRYRSCWTQRCESRENLPQPSTLCASTRKTTHRNKYTTTPQQIHKQKQNKTTNKAKQNNKTRQKKTKDKNKKQKRTKNKTKKNKQTKASKQTNKQTKNKKKQTKQQTKKQKTNKQTNKMHVLMRFEPFKFRWEWVLRRWRVLHNSTVRAVFDSQLIPPFFDQSVTSFLEPYTLLCTRKDKSKYISQQS
jgi:hypothetical protein